MCGVLAGKAHFTQRLTLGYRDAVALSDSPLYQTGSRAAAHEFHRTTVDFAEDYPPAWAFQVGDRTVRDGAVRGNVHAAYLHTHPAGQPESVRRLVSSARRRRQEHADRLPWPNAEQPRSPGKLVGRRPWSRRQ